MVDERERGEVTAQLARLLTSQQSQRVHGWLVTIYASEVALRRCRRTAS